MTRCDLSRKPPARVVLIGVGERGQWHLRTCLECDGVEVVALVDPMVDSIAYRAEHENQLNDARNIPQYRSIDARLAQQLQPDAAIVSVPHDRYTNIVPQLLGSGIPVLQEKPLATSVADAEQAFALADDDGPVHAVAAQRRSSPAWRTLNDYVATHGAPLAVQYNYQVALDSVTSGWRERRSESGGGALFDLGYHGVDVMVSLLGPPKTFSADTLASSAVRMERGLEQAAVAIMRFAGGTIASMMVAWHFRPRHEQMLLSWKEFSLALGIDCDLMLYDKKGAQVLHPPLERTELLHEQLHQFLAAVSGGDSVIPLAADAARTLGVIEDLRSSAEGTS